MKLRDTEVKDLLKQHEECYQARLLNPIQN